MRMLKGFIITASVFLLASVASAAEDKPAPATPAAPAAATAAAAAVEAPAAPAAPSTAVTVDEVAKVREAIQNEYTIGVDDVMDISVLQPEKLLVTVTVAPDGSITFPYIGNVMVKGETLGKVQDTIQSKLADGYMKYPVVAVSLRETRSKKFFVYGEVVKPGTYLLDERTTVLKAITMSGGFTKYGSSSRVKVLREKKDGPGYDTVKVNMRGVMDGSSGDDIVLKPGDIVVISEGVF